MIYLTRLNHHPLIVNSDLIKFVEMAPDTVITLITGEKIVVTETAEQVIERMVEFRQRSVAGGGPLAVVHQRGAENAEPATDDAPEQD